MRRAKPIKSVIKAFSHATEDLGKVRSAIKNILPDSVKDLMDKISILTVKGHYGNEIAILTLTLGRAESEALLKHILCNLSSTDRSILLATLDSRLDARHSHIHIRLSKQDAYLGRLRLHDGSDVIKVVVTITGVRGVEELRNYLESLAREC